MAKGWNICFIFNIWSYFHLSIKYWKVKSLFWGCFCVKFPKSYLKGIVMLNSIMMSNAPLRPIFIFAISKQILPACLPHDILYRLTKKGKISRCFRTRTSVIIALMIAICLQNFIWITVYYTSFFAVESRQVLCVPIICRSSEKFKNILLE